jgi:hypothetical protein
MAASVFYQQVFHVFKKLHMTTLVAGDSDTLHIFFDGAFHDLGYTAVVPEVDDLGSFALQYAAHDIDGGIMAVKQSGSRYDPDFLFGRKTHNLFYFTSIVQSRAWVASHTFTLCCHQQNYPPQ